MANLDTYDEIWEAVLDYCRPYVSETSLTLWLNTMKFTDIENNIVTLMCTSPVKKKIVIEQFSSLLHEAFENVLGFKCEINFDSEKWFIDDNDTIEGNMERAKEIASKVIELTSIDDSYPFTFETFVEGPSNKFAYRAAKAVAADPGGHINQNHSYGSYNPLFIYGKSGLGKTHILNAICHEIKKNFPEMKILYVRAEDFTNEFINALGRKTVDEFHEKYRKVDILLMDDVQFIGGKVQTEEEFFHTFNSLIERGKQIVLTSDRPPKEIQSLTERLCSRFENGLLADIQPPEYETRCAIIKNKAALLNFDISDEMVDFIAQKIKTNIRQLEGTTKKLHAVVTIKEVKPTIALAQQVIKDVIEDEIPPVPDTIQRVLEEVSRTEAVSIDDIKSSRQKANIAHARKMCMYIIREVTNLTLEAIGNEFGKNYSTVIYSINEIEKKMQTDSKLNRKINDIISNLKTEINN